LDADHDHPPRKTGTTVVDLQKCTKEEETLPVLVNHHVIKSDRAVSLLQVRRLRVLYLAIFTQFQPF
jgi:hypothetical protein